MNIRDVTEHVAKVKSLSGPSQPAKMVLLGERDGVPNHGHRNESLEPKGRAPHSPCWDVGGSNSTHWVDVTGMCKTFSNMTLVAPREVMSLYAQMLQLSLQPARRDRGVEIPI